MTHGNAHRYRGWRALLLSVPIATAATIMIPSQAASAMPLDHALKFVSSSYSGSASSAHGKANGHSKTTAGGASATHSAKAGPAQSSAGKSSAPTAGSAQVAQTSPVSSAGSAQKAPTHATSGKAVGKAKSAARKATPKPVTKGVGHKAPTPSKPAAAAVQHSTVQAQRVLGASQSGANYTYPTVTTAAITPRPAVKHAKPAAGGASPDKSSPGNVAADALRRIEHLTAGALGPDSLPTVMVAAFVLVFGFGIVLGATRRRAVA